jgi:curli biogenesis system outer membrane secretion channel CsgG
MQQRFGTQLFVLTISLMLSCAVVNKPTVGIEAPVTRQQQEEAQRASFQPKHKTFKRKIAIGRFTNETRYGRTFLRDDDLDPLGKQVSDMLSNRLVVSNKFLVFERYDLGKIKQEQEILGKGNLVGVDTLIVGSLTEFGRSTTGKSGFFSGTKLQKAHAKVEMRLVDVHTGQAFFSATGSGEATTESGQIAGFGSKASYDATLNDKAIASAISDVIGELVEKLEERPWRTDILKIQKGNIFLSGGKRQGLKVGDKLSVMRKNETIKSKQSGFNIELPPTPIGTVQIVSFFGDSESNEGSIAKIVSGSFASDSKGLFLAEYKEGQ